MLLYWWLSIHWAGFSPYIYLPFVMLMYVKLIQSTSTMEFGVRRCLSGVSQTSVHLWGVYLKPSFCGTDYTFLQWWIEGVGDGAAAQSTKEVGHQFCKIMMASWHKNNTWKSGQGSRNPRSATAFLQKRRSSSAKKWHIKVVNSSWSALLHGMRTTQFRQVWGLKIFQTT